MTRSSSAASRRRRSLTTILIATTSLACSKEAPRQSVEVGGTLSLDGTAQVVVRCEVRPSGRSVDLELHLAGGAVVTYAEAERAVLIGGERTRCTGGSARDIRWGTGAAGPFFHGGLSLQCDRVTADLGLRCGVLDEATRKELEGQIEKAKQLE
jgi:hypothetical protein